MGALATPGQLARYAHAVAEERDAVKAAQSELVALAAAVESGTDADTAFALSGGVARVEPTGRNVSTVRRRLVMVKTREDLLARSRAALQALAAAAQPTA